MTSPVELDLDALVAAASNAIAATRGEDWRYSPNYFAVTTSQPGILEGSKMVADLCNGADFEKERIGLYIAAAQPAVVVELVRRLRAAEAMVTPRVEEVSADLDEDAMLAAGWVRAEKTIPAPPPVRPEPKCKECGDEMCGGTGIYEFRKCDGIPF